MADESKGSGNKVTIDLDLDTKNFDVKIGGVSQGLNNLGTHGTQSFNGMQMATLRWNQALELAEKFIRGIEFAIDKVQAEDKIRNQAIALDNLSKSVGLNSKVLVDSIKNSTQGAVSNIEAQKIAFELLNSGIQARYIPQLAKLADQMASSGKTGESTTQIINEFTKALDKGSTKGLERFGIASGISGDRAKVLQAIINGLSKDVGKYGDEFSNTGDRLEAKWKNFTTSMGAMWTKVMSQIIETRTPLEIVQQNIAKLEDQIKKAQTGDKHELSIIRIVKNYDSLIANEQIVGKLEDELKQKREQLASMTSKLATEQAKTNQQLEAATQVERELTTEEAKRVEQAAAVAVAQRRASRERAADGQVSLKTLEDYKRARKVQIDAEAEDEREAARTRKGTRSQLMGELISIEERRRAKIDSLQQQEEQTNNIRRDTELRYLEQNSAQIEGAYQRIQQTKEQMENEAHQKKVANLAAAGLEEDEYKRKLEAAEMAHQERLKNIKDEYAAVNFKNLKAGVHAGLAQMGTQYANFANIAQRATVKTQNIMTNSFVQAAKGHGNAMELMKQQFLEMIGTEMIQSGTYGVLNGIITMNPGSVAAGTALIAAGMAIVGSAGGGEASSAGGGGGGIGDFGAAPGPANEKQLERKSAKIIINGDYLNSRETANHLAEVLRSNSDVTDYAIVAQGRQYS